MIARYALTSASHDRHCSAVGGTSHHYSRSQPWANLQSGRSRRASARSLLLSALVLCHGFLAERGVDRTRFGLAVAP